MSKKKNPVEEHKDKDAKLLRKTYLSIIENGTQDGKVFGSPQEIKNVIEAAKNLARMHHLLQPDKVTQKETKEQEETPFTEAQTKEIDGRLASILGDTWTGPSEPS